MRELWRFAAAIIVVLVFFTAHPLAQRQELGLLLGSMNTSDETLAGGASQAVNAFTFKKALTLQATYALKVRDSARLAVSIEVPFLALPDVPLASPSRSTPKNYAVLFVTPGIRVTFAPRAPVSVWGALGGGYARYEESEVRGDESPNPSHANTDTGAIQFGGGVDARGFGWLGFRGEVRDLYTGARRFSVATAMERPHNVVVSGGLILRF